MFAAVVLALGQPASHSLAGLIKYGDYPQWALEANEQGAVAMELLVNPNGIPERCSILVSTGFPQLDRYTCDLFSKRARFEPTTTSTGKPAYSLYDHVVTWGIDRALSAKLDPDIELQINRAPAGSQLPLDVKVSYLSHAAGSVSDCKIADSSKPAPAELVTVACQSLVQQPPAVTRNSNREAVDTWREATVRFTLDAASRSAAAPPTPH